MLKQTIVNVFVLFSCLVELVESSIKYGELQISSLDKNCAINCDQVVLLDWKVNMSQYAMNSKMYLNNFQHMFREINQQIAQQSKKLVGINSTSVKYFNLTVYLSFYNESILANNDYIYQNIISDQINKAQNISDFFDNSVYLPNIKYSTLSIKSLKSNHQQNQQIGFCKHLMIEGFNCIMIKDVDIRVFQHQDPRCSVNKTASNQGLQIGGYRFSQNDSAVKSRLLIENMEIVYESQTNLSGYSYQKVYQVGLQNNVSYQFQIQVYDEFDHVDIQNIRINNQNVLAGKQSDQVLFGVVAKRSLLNSSVVLSSSNSNNNRTIVLQNIEINGSRFQNYCFFQIYYKQKSSQTNVELNNITFNEIVVKDIKEFINVNGIGSSKLVDFKVQRIIVNSGILYLSNQSQTLFNRFSLQNVTNDVAILGANSSVSNATICFDSIDDLDLKAVVVDRVSIKTKWVHVIKTMNITKGKLSDFQVTNNQMNHSVFYIEGNRQTSGFQLDNFRLTNNSVLDKSNIYVKLAKLNIKNSHFKNNSGKIFGLFICQNSSLIVNNSYFNNNSAQYGGSFYSQDSNLIVDNSHFNNNFAQYGGSFLGIHSSLNVNNSHFSNNSVLQSGGSFYGEHTSLILTNSHFNNNYAQQAGGSFYGEHTSLILTNSHFNNNSAQYGGSFLGIHSSLNVNNSHFNNNHAQQKGGSFFSHNSNLTVTNTHFNNNYAQHGGSCFSQYDNLAINSSHFYNNYAQQTGGSFGSYYSNLKINSSHFSNNSVLKFGGSFFSHNSNLTVTNTHFNNNYAQQTGGSFSSYYSNLNISNIHFSNNSAQQNGGSISDIYSSLNINNTYFNNNHARLNGGSFYGGHSSLIVTNSHFNNNYAQQQNGGSFYNIRSTLIINNTRFNNNSAQMGGSFYEDQSSLTVNNSHFNNNSALLGGSFYGKYSNLMLNNSHFNNNSAQQYGGSFLIEYISNLIINNSNFNNDSAQYGGSFGIANSNLTVTNTHFNNNYAQHGGSIHSEHGFLTIDSSVFRSNNKTGITQGGQLHFKQGKSTIRNSEFYKSMVVEKGGAVYITDKHTSTITNVTCQNNTSIDIGGCMYFQNSTVNIDNLRCFDNKCKTKGGCIYSTDSMSNVINSDFYKNKAKYGSALYLDLVTNLTMKNNKIRENQHDMHGTVFSQQVTKPYQQLQFINNTFSKNLGKIYGSGLYGKDTNFSVINSSFYQNVIEKYGAAIAIFNGQLSILGSIFKENNSSQYGAAIYSAEKSQLSIQNCSFENHSNQIGTLYLLENQETKITKSKFISNSANDKAACIYSQQSSINISLSEFKGNQGNKTGCIDIQQGQLSISDSVFKENNSSQYGAAVCSQKSQLDIRNTIFESHNSQIGTLYLSDNQTTKITKSKFINNNANSKAACIYGQKSFTIVSLSEFKGNQGKQNGCIKIKEGQFNISNSHFSKQYSQQNGSCLSLDKSQNVVSNCKFIRNKAKQNGGTTYLIDSNSQITGSEFKESQANFGASVYSQDGQLEIKGNLIEKNEANMIGGGLYLTFSTESNNTYSIENNKFKQNKAQVAASIYFKRITHIHFKNNSFQQNKAQLHSDNILSYPQNMTLEIEEQNKQVKIKQIKSNQFMLKDIKSSKSKKYKLKFRFLNKEGQTITNLKSMIGNQNVLIYMDSAYNESSCNVQMNHTKIRYNNDYLKHNSTSGEYYYEDLEIVGQPGCEVILNFFSPHVVSNYQHYFRQKEQINQMNIQNILDDKEIFKMSLKIELKQCSTGEYHDQVNQICHDCPAGKFSLSVDEICRNCSDQIEFKKCFGGATTSLKNGYWRRSNVSKRIYKCNNQNCVTEKEEHRTQGGNYLCKKGHTGAVCEGCDSDGTFWGESYIQKSLNECSRCLSALYAFITLLGLIFVKMVFVYQMTTKSIQSQYVIIMKKIVGYMKQNQIEQKLKNYSGICGTNDERYKIACSRIRQNKIDLDRKVAQQQQNKEENNNNGKVLQQYQIKVEKYPENHKNFIDIQIDDREEILASTLIEIITIQFQVIQFIKQFNIKKFEHINLQLFVKTMNAPVDSYLDFSCVLLKISKNIPIIFKQNVMFNLEPLCIWLLLLPILWIQKKRGKIYRNNKSVYIQSIFILIFMMISNTVQSMMQSMLCVRYGDSLYIQQDVNLECLTSQHKQFIFFFYVPMMTIWLLVFPIGIVCFLYRNREQRDKYKFRLSYGSIYMEYQQGFYYWKFIKIYLTILVAIASSLKILGNISQGLIMIAIFGLYMFMIVMFKPYTNKSTNCIEFCNGFLCQIIITLTILFQISDSNVQYIILVIFWVFIFFFIKFYLIVSRFMFRDFYQKITMGINTIYKMVEEKIKSNRIANKIVNCLFKRWIRKKKVQSRFYNIVQKILERKEKEKEKEKKKKNAQKIVQIYKIAQYYINVVVPQWIQKVVQNQQIPNDQDDYIQGGQASEQNNLNLQNNPIINQQEDAPFTRNTTNDDSQPFVIEDDDNPVNQVFNFILRNTRNAFNQQNNQQMINDSNQHSIIEQEGNIQLIQDAQINNPLPRDNLIRSNGQIDQQILNDYIQGSQANKQIRSNPQIDSIISQQEDTPLIRNTQNNNSLSGDNPITSNTQVDQQMINNSKGKNIYFKEENEQKQDTECLNQNRQNNGIQQGEDEIELQPLIQNSQDSNVQRSSQCLNDNEENDIL